MLLSICFFSVDVFIHSLINILGQNPYLVYSFLRKKIEKNRIIPVPDNSIFIIFCCGSPYISFSTILVCFLKIQFLGIYPRTLDKGYILVLGPIIVPGFKTLLHPTST